jgi:Leucine-rich repeat (LRR) protein
VLLLSKNRIQVIPDEICYFKTLEVFDISENQISTLPQSIGNLQNLREINFAKNYLKDIPNTLSYCTKLTLIRYENNPNLDLTFNRFREDNNRVNVKFVLGFLRYRQKHQLGCRFSARSDAARVYYADHALKLTSWTDPRYFDFCRTLPYKERKMLSMVNDPNVTPLPEQPANFITRLNQNLENVHKQVSPDTRFVPFTDDVVNWGCVEFQTNLMCDGSASGCNKKATMSCPYRYIKFYFVYIYIYFFFFFFWLVF